MHKINTKWLLITIAFWGLALLLTFGLFNFVRELTTCWRLTSLPGLPPERCASQRVDALLPPIIRPGQTAPAPTATLPPELPEDLEYPSWDGGSRINILFVGLRVGRASMGECAAVLAHLRGALIDAGRRIAADRLVAAEATGARLDPM